MKIKLLLGLIAVLALTSAAYAQTVTVTPKKTVYTRKGKDVPKEKKTFTVTYPVITGKVSPAVRKKLAAATDYWKVFETTLAENLSEYYWLDELGYGVNYNNNGVLSLALTQEGSGPYPDSRTVHLNLNLKTGERAGVKDLFKAASLDKLAEMIDKKLDADKREVIRRIEKGEFSDDGSTDAEGDEMIKEQLNNLKFTGDSFDQFYIGDKGVTFLFDAGFPHVIQAAEPDGVYFFTWAELKPFIKSDGLLGQFIR